MNHRTLLIVAGLAQLLLSAALLAVPAGQALAAPLGSLTQTAEPPTRTPAPPTATAAPPMTPVPTATAAPPTPMPTAPTNEPEPRRADPRLSKTADVASARIGDLVTFTLTASNTGDGTARGVIVEDSLPAFLELVSAEASRGQVVVSGMVVGVWIGDLAPGELVTIRLVTRVVGPAAPPANRNGARLTTTSGSDDPANNEASVPIDVPVELQPTAAPSPIATQTLAPTPAAGDALVASPTPQAAPPAQLPATGAPGVAGPVLLLVAAAQLACGLAMGRRARRGRG